MKYNCPLSILVEFSIINYPFSINMYANISNPPAAAEIAVPRLDPDKHLYRVSCLSGLLALIVRARQRIAHCQRQYDTHSFLSSPFVSRERWQEDVRKWSYITYRLERYYLKKVCELNSAAYRSIIDNG